jgi:hypothetical protein
MKIVLGVNLFGNTQRHQISRESYLRLSDKFGIKLINLQFEGLPATFVDDNFETRHILKIPSNKLVPDSARELPTTKDCFDALASLDCDYFIFTNDDIIISPKYIELLLESKKDSYPSSRLSIHELNSLEDPITTIDHYQVAGFDAFIVKKEWWLKVRDYFPNYVLGKPCWDVHYALLCMRHGNSMLCNKWPPPTFHIAHDLVSFDDCLEKRYNEKIFWQDYANDARVWNTYLHNVLLKRPANYSGVFENEEELEQIYFKD